MPVPADRFLEKISQVFPHISWQTYEHITEGWDHDVIILDNKLVFRFPNDTEYYLPQLAKEINILSRLKSHVHIRIPHYTFVAPDKSFAGYEVVPGISLTRSVYASLGSEVQTAIAEQLAGFLSVLHTLDVSDFTDVPLATLAQDQREVRELTGKHLTKKLSAADLELVHHILDDVDVLLAAPVTPVFVHNDIYDRHILWDSENNQLGLIDFSDMNITDPAIDFGELYEYGVDFVHKVYELYTGSKDETFIERTFTYGQWAAVYMMTDHFISDKTTWTEARESFDVFKHLKSSY